MAQGGKRGTYPLLTLTMFVLAGTGALTMFCRPFVPLPEPGPLSTVPGRYMQAGAVQPVEWRTIADDPYAEARRLDLPVILVIGSQISEEARAYDRWVFSSREVATRMNEEFVCVRIDLDERPEWAYQFLPLSRAELTLDPAFQVWVTDAEGKVVGGLLDAPRGERFDPIVFLNLISDWHRAARATNDPSRVWELQNADADRLAQINNQATAGIGEYVLALEQRLGEFGIVWQGSVRENVLALRFLLQAGDKELFDKAYRAVLGSIQVDWVHGGLFEEVEVSPRLRMAYDKRASTSAEWAVLTAIVARDTGSDVDRWIAEWTFDQVWKEFATKDGVAAWVHTDSDSFGRNIRIGITPRTMNHIKPNPEAWGIEMFRVPNMGLRWTPIQSLDDFEARKEFLVRQQSVGTEDDHQLGPLELLGPTATFYARMLEAARVLNDRERAQPILDEWPRMRRFRSGLSDVVRNPRSPSPNQRALVDYVAYIDLASEVVAFTGNPATLADAIQVAKGALTFAPSQSLPLAGRSNPNLPESLAAVPAPLDGPGESPSAGLIRTLNRVSLALPDAERRALQGQIRDWAGATALMLQKSPQRAAGFYRAAARLQGARGILYVGDASSIPPELGLVELQVPVLTVLELKGLAPGVYVVDGDRRTGPMPVSEAVGRVRGGSVAP